MGASGFGHPRAGPGPEIRPVRGLGSERDPARHERLCAGVFAGARAIAPPLLVPFETVLDLLGETIGPRLLFVQASHDDSDDHALCLRPDLTLPAALAFAAAPESSDPDIVAYEGPAFRLGLHSRVPEEFTQIGREVFNGSGDVAEDLDLFARALAAAIAAGATGIRVQVSDMGLSAALIADLPLAGDWRGRLSRRLGRPTALTDLLGAGGLACDVPAPIHTADEARMALAAEAAAPLAGRTAEEIIARAAARGANDPLPRPIATLLAGFFALRGPFEPILAQAAAMFPGSGRVEAAIARAYAFCAGAEKLLAECGLASTEMVFSTKSGGTFDYYDGMVFALSCATAPVRMADGTPAGTFVPVGGGGRYDQLIQRVSHGARMARAAGFALRPDRLGLMGAEPHP